MSSHLEQTIKGLTGATSVDSSNLIQSLWSGYGDISRYSLTGCHHKSAIVKHSKKPTTEDHPYGWVSSLSNERKIKSYGIEQYWYAHFSELCSDACLVPEYFGGSSSKTETVMVLEDLNELGLYSLEESNINWRGIASCISWLANFHATFMGEHSSSLWENGTYWHLETRLEELEAMAPSDLKAKAQSIDLRLNSAKFQTLVHGDAKLANFCFSKSQNRVGAIDFQYIGSGCGMKDLAYFMSSCLDESECEALEEQILDHYFECLDSALQRLGQTIDFKALEVEWRNLFPFAWADFQRFLLGWSPGHWKINGYNDRLVKEVLQELALEQQVGPVLPIDFDTLQDIAISAILSAGAIVKEKVGNNVKVFSKDGECGSSLAADVLTLVDLMSQYELLLQIQPTCLTYDIALLAEETADDKSRLEKDYYWCIDPLDGTLPFIEGTSGYSISVALVRHDGLVMIGVVFDPVTNDLYYAQHGKGAFVNHKPITFGKPSSHDALTLVTDRSFLKRDYFPEVEAGLKKISKELGFGGKVEIISHGGAVMNACWLLVNEPSCYFKFPKEKEGGGCLWDYAATSCILQEAGAVVSDIKGDALNLNNPETFFMNKKGILYASSSELATKITELYDSVRGNT